MNNNEIIQQMVKFLLDEKEQSEYSKQLYQKHGYKQWKEAEKSFMRTLNHIHDEKLKKLLREKAYAMAFAYGDLYGEGVQIVINEIINTEENSNDEP